LTIDTELTWRHHAAGRSWKENYALSVEPAGVGLTYQLARLNEHDLKAVFFVDPMPAVLFGVDPIERMVSTILDAGQDVQLHLHPMWCQAQSDGRIAEDTVFELIDHDFDAQKALIERARDLLILAGAPAPIAFRSGSYAADRATLRALAALGIAHDCSHNGCEAPWPSALPLAATQVAPTTLEGVTEWPVSQMESLGGGLRHMQICAVSLPEMRAGLDHAIANDHPVFSPVGHSFELASRDGQRANAIVKRRFDGLCETLAELRDAAPTTHFADLASRDIDFPAAPAPASPVRTARRMAEQLWSNIIVERAA
jgi:hypothetical protein